MGLGSLRIVHALTKSIAEIDELCNIIRSPDRWAEAHEAFSSVRQLTLKTEHNNSDPIFTGVLSLAENVATIAYWVQFWSVLNVIAGIIGVIAYLVSLA